MRAVKAGEPGHAVWAIQETPQLGPGDLLVTPIACSICTSDLKLVRRGHSGPNPYALGHELVARVVQSDHPHHPIGQRVVVAPYLPCGTCDFCRQDQPTLCEHLFENAPEPGGLAEWIRIPARLAEAGLVPVPESVSSDSAALTEPLACCVQALDSCRVSPGDVVLVVGDGPMGLLNAAAARAYGASLVVVAGLTPARLEVASRHYAERVLDVRSQDLTREIKALTSGRGADVVLVAVSSTDAAENGLRALRRGGRFNMFAGTPEGTHLPLDLHRLHYDELILTGSFGAAPSHLKHALDLIASGKVDLSPLITGRYPFDRALDALDHMATQAGLKAVVLFE